MQKLLTDYHAGEIFFSVLAILVFVLYIKALDLMCLMRKEQPVITRGIDYVYWVPVLLVFAYYFVPKADRDKFSDKVESLSKSCLRLFFLFNSIIVVFLIFVFFG